MYPSILSKGKNSLFAAHMVMGVFPLQARSAHSQNFCLEFMTIKFNFDRFK